MGWVKDKFFGGAEKKAAREQVYAGEKAIATQQKYYDQARGDVLKLFPESYQQIATSYQQAIDQIGAGKASAADIFKQAVNQSNQITQSGSNAAISALLGRPQQMQLPQAMPQAGQTVGSKLMSNYSQPTGLRGNQFAQLGPQTLAGGMPQDRPMQVGGVQPQINQPQVLGGIAQQITDPNAPTMHELNQPRDMMQQPDGPQQGWIPDGFSQTQGQASFQQPTVFNAPLAQPQSLGPTPQVQNNVDMSGIGLSGAESALQAGLNAQTGALQGGSQQAQSTLQQTLGGQLGALNQGFGGAEEALNAYGSQALGAANQGFTQGRGDISSALGAAQGSIGQGIGLLSAAEGRGLGRIDQSTGQAINYLNPYSSTGAEAQQREAALSGALGNEAQQQAISGFMESPGQKFLRERQEQALLRNASATGGLRGGSTLSALQEQASGIAAQQQQQQLENMRNIAQRGQQAATQQGQFSQTGGISGANLIGQIAGQQAGMLGQQAGMQANAGSQLANLAAQGGQFAGNTLNQLGNQVSGLRSGLGQLQSGAIGNAGSDVAGLQNQLGGNLANAYGGTSSNVAGLRSQAGQQVAGQLNNQTNQLSNNQLNLGQMLAGLDTSTASQLAALMVGGGTAGAENKTQLAQILANLASGQGTAQSNIQIGQGNAQAAGTVGAADKAGSSVMAIAEMIAKVYAASDERLKENIVKIYDGAISLYRWTWKNIDVIPEGCRGLPAVGVIAQEVKKLHPSVVREFNGYLAVNYAELGKIIGSQQS